MGIAMIFITFSLSLVWNVEIGIIYIPTAHHPGLFQVAHDYPHMSLMIQCYVHF